jgi:hypothetical protein
MKRHNKKQVGWENGRNWEGMGKQMLIEIENGMSLSPF